MSEFTDTLERINNQLTPEKDLLISYNDNYRCFLIKNYFEAMSLKIMWSDAQKPAATFTDPDIMEALFYAYLLKKDRKGGYQDEIDEMFKKINR